MSKAALATQEFTTGWPIIGSLLLLSVPISGWITWHIFHDPMSSMHGNLSNATGLFLQFNGMVLGIGVLTAWQRVVLDFTTWTLHYANISTLHRWKVIPVQAIGEVTFRPASRLPKGMVDKLQLRVAAQTSERVQTVDILDGRIMPIFNPQPSGLFSAIVNFVRTGQPQATLPEKLVP